jgi:hypothetical protein
LAKISGKSKNINIEGKGNFTQADGGKYEGEWKNNKRDGKGTYIYKNKRVDIISQKDMVIEVAREHNRKTFTSPLSRDKLDAVLDSLGI